MTIYYEDEHEFSYDDVRPSIFLAGPSVRPATQSHLTSWRPDAVSWLRDQGWIGNIYIPEFRRPRWSDSVTHDLIEWEYRALCEATVIMFWIPRTEEMIGLTTNHEHGYWLAREKTKVVYGRPPEAIHKAYTDRMWRIECARYPMVPSIIHQDLANTTAAAINLATKRWNALYD